MKWKAGKIYGVLNYKFSSAILFPWPDHYVSNSPEYSTIYQASQKYGYTLKEIGQYLGLPYTTISKIIKKVEN